MNRRFTIKGKNDKDMILMDYFVNDENKLEFKRSNIFFNSEVRFVFNRQDEILEILGLGKEVRLKLEPDIILEFTEIEDKIKTSLNQMYQNILKCTEILICFPTGLEEFPLHITTKTILEEGTFSTKYVKGLMYALSDPQLKKASYNEQPSFKDYGDLQSRLGKHILSKDFSLREYKGSKAYILSLKEALTGI